MHSLNLKMQKTLCDTGQVVPFFFLPNFFTFILYYNTFLNSESPSFLRFPLSFENTSKYLSDIELNLFFDKVAVPSWTAIIVSASCNISLSPFILPSFLD